jgi:hypothetical protein
MWPAVARCATDVKHKEGGQQAHNEQLQQRSGRREGRTQHDRAHELSYLIPLRDSISYSPPPRPRRSAAHEPCARMMGSEKQPGAPKSKSQPELPSQPIPKSNSKDMWGDVGIVPRSTSAPGDLNLVGRRIEDGPILVGICAMDQKARSASASASDSDSDSASDADSDSARSP